MRISNYNKFINESWVDPFVESYLKIEQDIDDILLSFEDGGFIIKKWLRTVDNGSLLIKIYSNKMKSGSPVALEVTDEMIGDLNRLSNFIKDNGLEIKEGWAHYDSGKYAYPSGPRNYRMEIKDDHLSLYDSSYYPGKESIYPGDKVIELTIIINK